MKRHLWGLLFLCAPASAFNHGQILRSTQCVKGDLQRILQVRQHPKYGPSVVHFIPRTEVLRARRGEKIENPHVEGNQVVGNECPLDSIPDDLPGFCFLMSSGMPNDDDTRGPEFERTLAVQQAAGWQCM